MGIWQKVHLLQGNSPARATLLVALHRMMLPVTPPVDLAMLPAAGAGKLGNSAKPHSPLRANWVKMLDWHGVVGGQWKRSVGER